MDRQEMKDSVNSVMEQKEVFGLLQDEAGDRSLNVSKVDDSLKRRFEAVYERLQDNEEQNRLITTQLFALREEEQLNLLESAVIEEWV